MGNYEIPELDWQTAYHEAGHAVAAALCGEQWTSVRIMPTEPDPRALHTLLGEMRDVSRAYTPPANDAFICWAGAWAEARGTDGDLRTAQDEHASSDMERAAAYRGNETEDQWAAELESAWPQIEILAEQLVSEGTVYTRDGERIERDLDELVEPG